MSERGDWVHTKIGNQVTLQRGFDITKAEQKEGKIPVISSGGISSYHNECKVEGPGVILGRKGVVGSVYYANESYWPHDTTLWVKDFHGNFPQFVYYFFKNFAGNLGRMDVGSANPTLNRNHIHPLEVIWPSIETQKAIAHILGTLDDKIELNRQMNETLESIARAIFTSWFIDFDPVRAKAETRQPEGMDAATAALFPSEFETVEGQEIPKGWKLSDLGDFCYIIDCLHAKKPDRVESGFPLLQLNNIQDSGLLDLTEIYQISETDYQKWISRIEASEGDCVITNVGRVGAVSQIPQGFKAALGRNMTALRVKEKFPYPSFLIELLLSDQIKSEITCKTDVCTVLDALNVRNIPKLNFILPTKEVLSIFDTTIKPIRLKMESNLKENAHLSLLRDTLLPKLLSGELPITNPEQFTGVS